MGQKPSTRTANSAPTSTPLPPAEEYPPSGRILPGAYIIRNKASGTVLHLLSPYDYEVGEHCDIVGWTQESACLGALGRQIWWVEWDDIHQAYAISNVHNKGVVLDVMGSRSMMFSGRRGSTEKENLVCARPRVRSIASSRSSTRSSARSSLEIIRRDDLLDSCSNGGLALTESSVSERVKSQRWILRRAQPTSECFSIHNLLCPNICLDLDWGKTENNTKIQLCPRTGVNHQQWNFIIPPIPSMNPPVGSWCFLVNHKTGGFLHHADRDYPPACIKLSKWDGIGEKREYWGLHWCFVLASDTAEGPKWYIKNRVTGTLLEHWAGRKKGDSVKADSHLYTESKEWRMDLLPTSASAAKGDGTTGLWGLVNAESDCALEHYSGRSVQCYQPGIKDEYKQWKIIEIAGPFVDYGAATLLSPPVAGTPLPTLSMSCTALPCASNPASSSLQPLIMPSGASFHYLEPSVWPVPACSPSSRDILGHEERSFFELLSRIETQLIVPGPYVSTALMHTSTASAPITPILETPVTVPVRPRSAVLTLPMGFFDLVTQGKALVIPNTNTTGPSSSPPGTPNILRGGKQLVVHGKDTTLTLITPTGGTLISLPRPPVTATRKRILAESEGWTTWAFGYSRNGSMTNWNSLVESSVVRHSDRRDRYIVSFYEGVAIIRGLLQHYFDSQSAMLSAGCGGGMVVLPSRFAWLVLMAGVSLEKVVRLRKAALEEEERGNEECFGRMGADTREVEAVKAARDVNQWVARELERVLQGWKGVEELCLAGRSRKAFVH